MAVLLDAVLFELALSLQFLLNLKRQLVNVSLSSIFRVGPTGCSLVDKGISLLRHVAGGTRALCVLRHQVLHLVVEGVRARLVEDALGTKYVLVRREYLIHGNVRLFEIHVLRHDLTD